MEKHIQSLLDKNNTMSLVLQSHGLILCFNRSVCLVLVAFSKEDVMNITVLKIF